MKHEKCHVFSKNAHGLHKRPGPEKRSSRREPLHSGQGVPNMNPWLPFVNNTFISLNSPFRQHFHNSRIIVGEEQTLLRI